MIEFRFSTPRFDVPKSAFALRTPANTDENFTVMAGK